jgi:hypothetical protein
MKTIQSGQTLTANSACDHNCTFSLLVIERKGNFANILMEGEKKPRRTKVRIFGDSEYLRPDTYSMAPIFNAL